MAKKQSSRKPSKKTAKAPKTAAVPTTPKPARTRERDPRLPAAGATLVRVYKGKEHRIKVLGDGFEHEGTHYRSLTALARVVTGYKAISGPMWAGIAERAPATPKPASPKEKPVAPAKGRAPKVRRAGRDAPPAAPKEDASEVGAVSETPAV